MAASGGYAFPKSKRLLSQEHYRFVFAQPVRASDDCLTVIARLNGTGHARLGLALSRKVLRRAVDRNRVKRIIRETFRLRHSTLPGLDIVVMARPGCAAISSDALRNSLIRHWNTLLQRCASSSYRSSGSTASS